MHSSLLRTLRKASIYPLSGGFHDPQSSVLVSTRMLFILLSPPFSPQITKRQMAVIFLLVSFLDPVQNQLHGAMAKAEMEVSQRLLNVLPIQPPAPLDRPTAHRRLYDRHSVTIGESEEYNRMFRQNGKRNSIDILGRTANSSNNSSATAINASNNPTSSSGLSGSSSTGSLNGNPNGHANGVIGSAALSESISARVNQFRPAQGSLNRISAPNVFGGRPKSVHEGDTSSMFTSNWNFASLGANPLPSSTSGAGNGSTSNVATASSSAGSPGNIGDRTSYGRPKSVGGAEWMLSRPQSAADGLDKPWTPLIMSPTMGGFHNGTNGTGHSLSAGGFSNSGLAVERPKSVTEADLAKLNISQWVHNNNINGASGNAGSRTSTLEELKANNRRRTLLRPSAIISNVPVTVMEGDEKLLSASANTSSINIVSTMFNEAPGAGSGSNSMTDMKAAGTTTSSASQVGGSMFSYSGSQPNLNTFSQQQQQAVHQLNNLSLDSALSSRNAQHQQAQQHQQHQHHYQQQQQPRSRATSPFSSPLPSPVKSGFRSRPVSGSTSPRLAGQHSAWMPGGSNCNSSNSLNNLVSDGNAIIPTDYNQKRHLSPPSLQRVHPSTSLSLDDDYLSDTSDISSIGMNGHHGRSGSASKEKKQPEGVDFELLQGKKRLHEGCIFVWTFQVLRAHMRLKT